MATIPFVKASACGNDFLLIDGGLAPVDIAQFTRRICDRHEGVGADGVEWMFEDASADVEIRLLNADGSKAEISGNGTRCVAAHIYTEQAKEKITIRTGAGLRNCTLTGRRDHEYEFEADMGEAEVFPELDLNTRSGKVSGIQVSLGNPHYVVFVPAFARDWQAQAMEIQGNSNFRQGVNVEFVVVDGRHDVQARFYERGAGQTQSSGTGSCAVAVASIASGSAESPVRIHTSGGIQVVRMQEARVLLRGSARLVCRGEFIVE